MESGGGGAVSRVQRQKLVGTVQTGHAGMGMSDPPVHWSRAGKKESKDLVVFALTKDGRREHRVKAVARGQQGHWTTWEGVEGRCLETATGPTQFPQKRQC